MGFLDGLRTLFSVAPMHERHENVLEQVQIQGFPNRYTPWRIPSTREAIGVPAVFRAISLISNTSGRLSLEAYRKGARLDADTTPIVVKRPNPLTTPQVFFRDTTFYMALCGEVWEYVASRDGDGNALASVPVDPREVIVTENPRNALRPRIEWRGRVMDNDDFRQITLLPDPNNPLRGIGPLQACGAALSVAIESREWASNYFNGGGVPSVLIKAGMVLSDDGEEAEQLRQDWIAKPSNVPRVIDQRIESVEAFGADAERSQAVEQQMNDVGEVARMFGIPGALLEYSAPGSSLTYTNVESVWRQFLEGCLTPNYLEPIEQTISDFLTRSTVVRFSLKELLRADVKTRYEVHNLAIPLGIYDAAEAARQEGFEPGDVETRPVPVSPPAAVPTPSQFPQLRSAGELRCAKCDKLILPQWSGYAKGNCPRCKTAFERSDTLEAPSRTETSPVAVTVNIPEHMVRFEEGAITVGQPDVTVNIPEQMVRFEPEAIKVETKVEGPAPQDFDIAGALRLVDRVSSVQTNEQEEERLRLAEHQQAITATAERFEQSLAEHDDLMVKAMERATDDSELIGMLNHLREGQDQLRQAVMSPRVQEIERDPDGRMIRVVQKVAS